MCIGYADCIEGYLNDPLIKCIDIKKRIMLQLIKYYKMEVKCYGKTGYVDDGTVGGYPF
ncbi:hypothetical protein GCM10008910_28400 [Faecalicatena orotica]